MENTRLKELAGLLTEKKWSGDVKTKVEVPEGTFKKKAGGIVKTLLKLHDGDRGEAMKALTFYINRCGKDCENKEELDAAKAKLKKVEEAFEAVQHFRRTAGLPLLEKKMSDKDMDAMDAEAMDDGPTSDDLPPKDDKTPKADKKDDKPAPKKDDEDDLPKIVAKIAKNVAKKFGIGDPKGGPSDDLDFLEDLLMKVYEAGMKDADKAPKADKKDDKPAKKDDKKDDKKDAKKDDVADDLEESYKGDFSKMSDAEVCKLFKQANSARVIDSGTNAALSKIKGEMKKRGIRADILG